MKFGEAIRFFNYLCRTFGVPALPREAFAKLPRVSVLEGQFSVEGENVVVEFAEGDISANTVMHEFLHYIFFLADMQQALRGRSEVGSLLDDVEERFAYHVSSLLAKHFYKTYSQELKKTKRGSKK